MASSAKKLSSISATLCVATPLPSLQGYGLSVAGRALTTPQKNPLQVSSAALAQRLADEWNAAKGMFRPEQMVMTTLVYTAIDRVAPAKAQVVEALLEFLSTDTLCCWSPESDLSSRQRAEWLPVIEWARARYAIDLHYSVELTGLAQNETAIAEVKAVLMALEPLEISVLGVLAPAYGSLILALCVKEGVTDAIAAYRLSALEADFQAERWGRDPELEKNAARIVREVELVQHFLRLLDYAKSTSHTH